MKKLNEKVYFNVVVDEFNAKIGLKSERTETSLGKFGSEGRNERGEKPLGFCYRKTCFK